ncbi:prolyl aminopeptidase [Thalassotalea castellviae]|uniref:Proline iminopeptidase n=1 Tax=Thalassotalea castellviae TaxID=3075612 RepID=A0ABU3A5N4_9GAMM|nr:prolyl aminopeptidase [Thalassotalea sp. W431]MDT0605150.1 prolyl aminopeptidase [Thalassotalea sp. W431]
MSRALYPKIKHYHHEWLKVDDVHQIYLEQSGNPNGIPVLYLHGGPGGGSSNNHRRYFDPEKYRIIIFDQRGCGQSKPSPSIENNHTDFLIEDIEKIRQHLSIDKWLISGGSWGTTLALIYGIRYPQVVLGFILRGIFLGTKKEYDWLYQVDGAERFFPEYYQDFIKPLEGNFQDNLLEGYQQIFSSDNEVAKIAACKAWYLWELRLSTIEHHHIGMAQIEDSHQALCMAQLSHHYFYHHCFIEENYILNNIANISDIPAIIIHGRYDMVCPLNTAANLTKHWVNASLQILPQAGHSGFESQTIDALCKATDVMANFLQETKR